MTGRSDRDRPLGGEKFARVDGVPPQVTVIVTSYNYENYLIRCLASIAKQDYPRFHCVVVDDVSTDGSVARIQEFIDSAEAAGRFSLVQRAHNGGQMAAIKTGLQHAEGVFVVVVDADDLLFENFISAHVAAHMGPRTVAFTSSNAYQINENDELLASTYPHLGALREPEYHERRPVQELDWVWATTSSMMFRRSILDLIMPEDTEPFRICADNYLCQFAQLLSGSLLLPEALGCYRRHGKNHFAIHPVLGDRFLTADMKRHPEHDMVRMQILEFLLREEQRFLGMLKPEAFFGILVRLAEPHEVWRMRRRYPQPFEHAKFPWLKYLLLHSALTAKLALGRYLSYLE